MIALPAHLIGHGWRDLLVYGGAALAMLGGFMVYSSGRATRMRSDREGEATDELADQPGDELLIRRDDGA